MNWSTAHLNIFYNLWETLGTDLTEHIESLSEMYGEDPIEFESEIRDLRQHVVGKTFATFKAFAAFLLQSLSESEFRICHFFCFTGSSSSVFNL